MNAGGVRFLRGLVVTGLALSLFGCRGPAGDSEAAAAATVPAPAQASGFGDFAAPAQLTPRTSEDSPAHTVPIPGLGPQTMAEIPQETTQVLVATGAEAGSTEGSLSVHRFAEGQWQEVRSMPFHNGAAGWLADRREGDETSPIGVFTLTDAGGAEPDPGTALPYTHETGLSAAATATYGQEFAGVFDYVIAIDYNRVPGTPPTDDARPLGWDRGGGIWLHVDHDSPTHGCITLEQEDLLWLLGTLEPTAHPRIAMGPAAELRR